MRIIAGRWRGHPIKSPRGRHTRPTTDRVREAWMSALQPSLGGARVLDLYAGSGALGLEALSRGAAHVTFVERSGAALRVLKDNVRALGAGGETSIVRGDALAYVERLGQDDVEALDIVLADPPYDTGAAAALARRFVRVPFAGELWIEHRVSDPMPELESARVRRYGDTVITAIPGEPPTAS